MTTMFGLRADGLVQGARELERGTALEAQVSEAAKLTIPSLLQSFVPSNIFADLAGTRSTSVIGVVIFAALLGLAVLALRRDNPEVGERVLKGIESLQQLIMRLVRIVIRLTPYGVLALMTRVVANSNVDEVINLGGFVVASYIGMGVILLMHALILTMAGLNPVRFFQKIWPVLTFVRRARRRGHSSRASTRRSPGWRLAGHRLRGQLRRDHRAERMRRSLPRHARGDDRAERRHRSVSLSFIGSLVSWPRWGRSGSPAWAAAPPSPRSSCCPP